MALLEIDFIRDPVELSILCLEFSSSPGYQILIAI